MNFNSVTLINQSNTTNSIAGDMLNIANQTRVLGQFNPSYELLGYNTFVLDYDSASGKYFSFVDLKRSLSQTRGIENSGRMNEINLSFAQSHDDKFYIGGSLGIPRLKFESTTKHSETDSNDSMQINLTSPSTFTTSYLSDLPFIYTDKLGFHSLNYREFFKTEGYGINLKLGAIVRLNANVRVGGYFHSPTIYYLTDTYGYSMEARFDYNTTQPIQSNYPEGEGRYEYRIVTPMRYGISGSYIDPKIGAFSIDIENLNYNQANLSGETPDVFSGVNAVIKSKYRNATNIRTGFEYNLNPFLLRAGYAYYGSPFGGFFSGPFDRHTLSFGAGYRSKDNFFYDFAWIRTFTKEDYYMFSTNPVKSNLVLISSHLIISAGIKF
jgi:long-subunit fatty acid transport protein